MDWIKKHRFKLLVLLVIAYFTYGLMGTFLGTSLTTPYPYSPAMEPGFDSSEGFSAISAPSALSGPSLGRSILPPYPQSTPKSGIEDRLVIQDSSLSLLVENVIETREIILDYARQSGGYMVSARTSSPEDAASATIVVRVPTENLDKALEKFRSLSVKVVSENLVGRDVTDQYMDLEERLATLERTKARFEAILEQATEIQDITNVTQQIINYQDQIDYVKGQQLSLEQNAALTKVTIYLSTDEIALPYTPSETFRPNVIFKLAVRSLVGTLRNLASLAIWLGVYSVIWIPAILIYFAVRRLRERKSNNPRNSVPN